MPFDWVVICWACTLLAFAGGWVFGVEYGRRIERKTRANEP